MVHSKREAWVIKNSANALISWTKRPKEVSDTSIWYISTKQLRTCFLRISWYFECHLTRKVRWCVCCYGMRTYGWYGDLSVVLPILMTLVSLKRELSQRSSHVLLTFIM